MRKAFFFILFCCYFQPIAAQPQTPDALQQAAIDKITFAVKTIFNKLNNPDWVLRSDYYSSKMVVTYQQAGAPLGVNNNYGRVYDLKAGSPTFQKIILPLLDHKNELAAAGKYDSLKAIDNKIQVLSHFEIHANINMANVNMGVQSKKSAYEALSVKGPAYSSKTNTSTNYGAIRTKYTLLFGDWDESQCEASPHSVHFHFKHAEKTPFVENIIVDVIGDGDFVNNFVNKTDWSPLAGALTL